jgi:hypothetical protein
MLYKSIPTFEVFVTWCALEPHWSKGSNNSHEPRYRLLQSQNNMVGNGNIHYLVRYVLNTELTMLQRFMIAWICAEWWVVRTLE